MVAALVLEILAGVEFNADLLAGLYLDMVGKAAQMWLWCAVTTRRRDPLVSAYFVLVALSRITDLGGLVDDEFTLVEQVVFGLPVVVTGALAVVHIWWGVGKKYDQFMNCMA